jgi:hypothetical protein
MLHGGASQLPQGPQHSFKFYFMTPEKDAVAPKFELTLFLETTILTKRSISLIVQGTLSERCSTVWGQ